MFEGLKLTPDIPPVWLAVFAGLASVLAHLLPIVRFEAGPLGGVLILIGLGIIIWSAIWFWRKDTPIEPGHTPKVLIVEGPYRLSRNPIYLGLALILFGYALNRGAASAMLPAILYPVLIHVRFILPEEDLLRGAFGAEAERYLAATRRWI